MKDEKNMHAGHRARLRKEILSQNIENILDHKYLELLLTYAIPYKDVNPLAHKLLNEFGSIEGILQASKNDLMKVDGVGEKTATFLKVLNILPQKYNLEDKGIEKEVLLKTPQQTVDYLRKFAKFGKGEEFTFLCLDTTGRLLYSKKIGSGLNFSVLINKREVLSKMIKPNVHSIIICHTHPFGSPEPSRDDVCFTQDLYKTLKSIDIRLCDHVILTNEGYFSFFKNKLLSDNSSNNFKILDLDFFGDIEKE